MKLAAALLAATLLSASFLAAPALAQTIRSEPQPLPYVNTTPPPKDVAYPGTVTLYVDATDIERRIMRIRQSIPVAKAGPLTLLYPEWIMGNHAPRGPIYNYAGLKITANGKAVPWVRDPEDVYAFHLDVPAGAKALDVEAQFLTPIEAAQGGRMMTPEMLRLNWYVAALTPAGYYARRIPVEASVKLPAGWDYGTALEQASASGGVVKFKTANWETVIDSPLIAGKYLKKIDLDPGGRSRVTLNVAGDEPGQVAPSDKIIEIHRNLIKQADKLYGARHYDHYDFILSISDLLAGSGVEHQRSSDNGTTSNYFKTWDTALISRDLLAHEYTHSWNGKYRRPADLWTPNFNTPMRDSLLWVYEGQTQFWGWVLSARAGFVTTAQAIDQLAATAAIYDSRIGRTWRPLMDTTNDPIIAARRSLPSTSWQRSEDYYSEGQLIWLDADSLIREKSGGKRGLDDFARAFFGINDGDWGTNVYQRKDMIEALNKIQPYDWTKFLADRVDAVAPRAPLAGLERDGWKLVYGDTPNEVWKANDARGRSLNLTYSVGLSVDSTGKITSVQWDGPAFKAGLTTAVTLTGVGVKAFSLDRLRDAVEATKSGAPVKLSYRQGDDLKSVTIDYRGGHKYPRLERIPGKPDLLTPLLTAK